MPRASPLSSNGLESEAESRSAKRDNIQVAQKPMQGGGGLKSVKAVVAILLAHMGKKGMENILSLAAIAIGQGARLLFRAAFLRRVPLFMRLISENLILCLHHYFQENTHDDSADLYVGAVLATSTPPDTVVPIPLSPQLCAEPRHTPARIQSLLKILVPSLSGKQGGQLLAVALLVVGRTWISDRIADLTGTSVKYVLEQDKPAFIRLMGTSVLQSAASAIVAPSLGELAIMEVISPLLSLLCRNLTAQLALGWRYRLTEHLSTIYFQNNAYYKVRGQPISSEASGALLMKHGGL